MANSEKAEITWRPGRADAIGGLSMRATTMDGHHAEQIVIAPYSTVRHWAVPSRRLTKDEVEIWHLGQLACDLGAGTGRAFAPFGARKSEHPDFLVLGDQGGLVTHELELVAYTPGLRREVEHAISPVRDAIQSAQARLGHLAGCHLRLVPDPLPDSVDAARVSFARPDELVEGIVALERPLPQPSFTDGFPEKFPEGVFVSKKLREGVRVVAYEHVPLPTALSDPTWQLPRVDPMFQLTASVDEIRADLAARIARHSYAETLVVVAGGPDPGGAGFMEDEALLRGALDRGDRLDLVERSEQEVFIHWWSNGRVERFNPNPEVVVEAIPEHLRRITLVTWEADEAICFVPGAEVLRVHNKE